jgi:hypothetical protein
LGTLISHGIFIFPREISSFYLGKMKIPWEISVPKLALSNQKHMEAAIKRTGKHTYGAGPYLKGSGEFRGLSGSTNPDKSKLLLEFKKIILYCKANSNDPDDIFS